MYPKLEPLTHKILQKSNREILEDYIITITRVYNNLIDEIDELNDDKENLLYILNDLVFTKDNNDVEDGARTLKKFNYIGFDDERKVWINKHNNDPIMQEDEREKSYYIKDDQLDDYTKQLEYRNQQLEEQLHQASLDIQELIERDIDCPSNCDKLIKLQNVIDEVNEFIDETCWYPDCNNYSNMTDYEVKELVSIIKGGEENVKD